MTNTPRFAPLDMSWFESLGLGPVAAKVAEGQRLSIEDGERLFACAQPTALGALAHHARLRRHGLSTFYVVNRHLNYSNVCVNTCLFCAFRRDAGQDGAFTHTMEELLDKVRAIKGLPREIHVVGSCHPSLRLAFFEELLARIGEIQPQACLKCFTAVEIAHFAALEGITPREVLLRLQAAGLCMLPGGGAEIFAPRVRQLVCPEKLSGAQWLDIHRTAHELGMKSNCTMLFGHRETPRERLDHLDALRRLQDETGGFECLIPLPFQTRNNRLEVASPLTGVDELSTIAISRLMLDNIPHIKAYWVMLGVLQAQLALFWGADDLDGTVIEERIGHMAGAQSDQALERSELEAMIQAMGLNPVERDGLFRPAERQTS